MASTKTIDGGKHAGPSARDLTGKQWYAATLVPSTGEIDVVAVAKAEVIGVIEYPGDAKGKTTTVLTLGRGKVKLGNAAVAALDRLTTNADGTARKAVAGERYFGTALAGGSANAIVPFNFDRGVEPA